MNMLTILHRYVRRLIRWANMPSDEELAGAARKRAVWGARRLIHKPEIGVGLSRQEACDLLAVLDEAAVDPFAGVAPSEKVAEARRILTHTARGHALVLVDEKRAHGAAASR